MARETLKDFLSSIGSGADKISFVQKESPDGLGVDPNTGLELLDLVNETKGLLGDYLEHIVDNSTNEFKIQGGNEMAASSNRGDSLVIPDEQGAKNIFVPQGTEHSAMLNQNSNSTNFDASGTPLKDLIDKTGKDSNFHNKLKEIQGRNLDSSGQTLVDPSGESNDIVQATQRVFLKNNRFANVDDPNRSSFSVNPQNIEEFENFANNRGTLNIQREFGVYDKENFKTSFNRLKNIGASLLLRSSGYLAGQGPISDEASSSLIAAAENAISDGINNSSNVSTSGFEKRSTKSVRAKNSIGFPADGLESVRSNKGSFVIEDPDASNSKTFGSTYNHMVHFNGKNRNVLKVQAAIAIISLKAVASSFYEVFSSFLRDVDSKAVKNSTDEYIAQHGRTHVGLHILGQSRKLSALVLDSRIFTKVMTQTTYPYDKCVNRGLEVVFSTKTEVEDISSHQNVAQSPGFWLSVSNSVLKSYDSIVNKISEIDTASYTGSEIFTVLRDIFDDNAFLSFYNVMAVIGDISLQSTNSTTDPDTSSVIRLRDVDGLDNKPGNRVSKSRVAPKENQDGSLFFTVPKADIAGKNTLAWEQSATPSIYLLPVNMIRAANLLNNSRYGPNPMNAMLGSRMSRNTYFSIDNDGTFNRIPNRVVKIVEDRLDAEYVPFYLHDLRTNEILSFHAFLTSLTDSISPNFTATSGYGRLDPVQTYSNTTRSLQVGFVLYATNREDFDEMWYKINKFVTMLYPQWTQGTLVNNTLGNFYVPFSQVIGASPIVRLRVGDVIKSNYSRFNLARTFGIGDKEVTAKTKNTTNFAAEIADKFDAGFQKGLNSVRDWATLAMVIAMGSPIGVVTTVADQLDLLNGQGFERSAKRLLTDATVNALSELLVNGFANPFAVANSITELRDPNVYDGAGHGNSPFKNVIIKPNTNVGYYSPDDNRQYLLSRRVTGKVREKVTENGKIMYDVLVIDGIDTVGLTLRLSHDDILADPASIFANSLAGIAFMSATLDAAGIVDSLLSAIPGKMPTGFANILNPVYSILSLYLSNNEVQFMDPANNPFTRAFETTKGRGLAGVMKSISFNWLDSNYPWETDFGARAPRGVEISFGFDVIHDLPPGLDHSGYNRAPLYNVGEIMNNIAGDPHGKETPFGGGSKGRFIENGFVRAKGSKDGKK